MIAGEATMDIVIRAAMLADSPALGRLMSDLGYPTSSAQMATRLTSILGDGSYQTFVACAGETIASAIGTRVGPMYEMDSPYGQIMALVVGAEYRRHGVGLMLLRAVESRFVEHGAVVSVVTSPWGSSNT